jgi:FAD/FMN-containing dehydrogenase
MSSLQIATLDGGQREIAPGALDGLQSGMRGRLVRPGDESYDATRAIWNGHHDRRPALIIRCQGVGDVVDAVKFARDHRLLVSVRGGGHNVAGTSMCDGGVCIDLSLMKGIHVDPVARRARVEAGATWADLDREAQVFALAAPGGIISSTGVAGLTLGGGMGWLRRLHGMSADNLIGVEIVTADGELRRASTSENPDLFWAVRGGGGNFGIVTSFRFMLHPVGPVVMLAAPMYPAEHAMEAMRFYREFCASSPDQVSSYALFMTVAPVPAFPAHAHGRKVVAFPAVYTGPVEEGAQRLQMLREFAEPLIDLSGPIPYRALQQAFDWVFPKGGFYYWKTTNLRGLDDDVLDVLVPIGVERSSPATVVGVWQLGGAMARVGPADTAYGRRDAPFLVNLDSAWREPAEAERHIAWTRDAWARLRPFSDGGMYLHYNAIEAEAEIRAAYGDNYDRLARVKAKFDPDNLFRLNQNIRPDPEQVKTSA